MRKGQIVRAVTVERLEADARGSAVVGGTELLAAGACPGDVVDLEVTHVSPHAPRAWCEVARVRSRGPVFAQPACGRQWPVRGRCGGCPAMHVDGGEMGRVKRRAVVEELGRRGIGADVTWSPAPEPLGYRNRGQFVAARIGGRAMLGSYENRSHVVADMSGCPVLRDPIWEVAAGVEEAMAQTGVPIHPEPGGVRHVTVRASSARRALVDLVVASKAPAWLDGLASAVRSIGKVDGVSYSVNRGRGNAIRTAPSVRLHGSATCEEEIPGLALELEASSFSQLNSEVAGRMYGTGARTLPAAGTVWDLYCGVGGLGLTAAILRDGLDLFGADSVARSVELAGANAVRAGVKARYEAIDLSRRGPSGWPAPDAILVNPPRRGLDAPVLELLERTRAPVAVYMSCSPSSFARDAGALVRAGWRLVEVGAHDMLPGTTHVEIMASFAR